MSTSLYLHIPFCTTRCGYCDFNTYAGLNHLIPQYVEALCKELQFYRNMSAEPITVHTIYFGGGTPSLLPAETYTRILAAIREAYDVLSGAEITLEANPGSVSPEYMAKLHSLGFNRISLGMQSAHPAELALLNRKHDFDQVSNGVHWAKDAGFEHISLDLIFGIPGQTLESWQQSLQMALGLPVDHLSLYSLTVEERTPLFQQVASGQVAPPDEDLAGEMYALAMETLPKWGFSQYEISNWAVNPSARSIHNMQYWRCDPYLGIGAGAHGYFGHYRYENTAGIAPYILAMQKQAEPLLLKCPVQANGNYLTLWDEMQEFMMLGLRLTEDGVSSAEFSARFGYSLEELFHRQLTQLFHQELLEKHPTAADRLRVTQKGIRFGNRVFAAFVGNKKPAVFGD